MSPSPYDDLYRRIFRQGSQTFYHSSRFFPPAIRKRVFRLYGFVRRADDYVDAAPQDKAGFENFRSLFHQSRQGKHLPHFNDNHELAEDAVIIDEFTRMERELSFPPEWAEAFLQSMAWDLTLKKYNTLEETLDYIYGSAEVIGFFMCRILGLPDKALRPAAYQGRAMQYINFIRDIAEDHHLGRRYLPLREGDPPSLDPETIHGYKKPFKDFLHRQLRLYRSWQAEAEKGYSLIPRRYRIPVETAARMYRWTARQIEKEPLIVYRKQVKPSRRRIIGAFVRSFL